MQYLYSCLSLIALISYSIHVKAQCIPDASYTQPGVYPDSIPTAYASSDYLGVINFRTPPKDTSLQGIPATIDSIVIVGYDGLPSGFSADCNIASCQYLPSTNGCLAISGNPTDNDIGVYPLTVYLTTYFTIFGVQGSQPDTADQFILQICASTGCQTSIASFNNSPFSGVIVFPNPMSNSAELQFNSLQNSSSQLLIYNAQGQNVMTSIQNVVSGKNTLSLPVQDLVSGVYFVSLIHNNTTISSRFVKQ